MIGQDYTGKFGVIFIKIVDGPSLHLVMGSKVKVTQKFGVIFYKLVDDSSLHWMLLFTITSTSRWNNLVFKVLGSKVKVIEVKNLVFLNFHMPDVDLHHFDLIIYYDSFCKVTFMLWCYITWTDYWHCNIILTLDCIHV